MENEKKKLPFNLTCFTKKTMNEWMNEKKETA